jgi:hypothetical protein
MSAGWVAGTVRAKAMARRALGVDAARRLAASTSLGEAQRQLQATPFRSAAEPRLSLDEAQHAVAATILWDMRVLAGWLPRDGVSLLRLLAGWFEIANVDELLQALAGRPSGAEFQLGALATAWPRLREASSAAEARHVLSASAWGDPGGDTDRDIRLGIRIRWAARIAASGDRARVWAAEAAAVLTPTQPSVPASVGVSAKPGDIDAAQGRAQAVRRRVSPGRSGPAAGARPRPPRPASDVAAEPVQAEPLHADPWQAEAAWWRQVEHEGRALLRSSATSSEPVLGAVIVMAADARRVRAALGCAARGGRPLEVYDAVG